MAAAAVKINDWQMARLGQALCPATHFPGGIRHEDNRLDREFGGLRQRQPDGLTWAFRRIDADLPLEIQIPAHCLDHPMPPPGEDRICAGKGGRPQRLGDAGHQAPLLGNRLVRAFEGICHGIDHRHIPPGN